MQRPRTSHLQALHHTLKYIQGTIGQGILLKATDHLSLKAYSDSDWAACPFSRRSVTGYVIHLGNSPISWKSKKQSTVSRSSSEAEYRAMATVMSELIWVKSVLAAIGIFLDRPMYLFCDNQATLHIAKNTVFLEIQNTSR